MATGVSRISLLLLPIDSTAGDSVTKLLFVGMAMLAYLLLLARSAWKQGQFRQFLVSLGVLAVVGGVLSGIVAIAVYLDGH